MFFYHCAQQALCVKKNSPIDYRKKCLVLNIFIIKKNAAVILNFCLIGNIRHKVPTIIESAAPKTFMPIQTPDLHRVVYLVPKRSSQPRYLRLLWFATQKSICFYKSKLLKIDFMQNVPLQHSCSTKSAK